MTYSALRKAAGLSQAELARCLEVSQPAIAAYESGRRTPDGTASDRYRVLSSALTGPTRSYGFFRAREVLLPDDRWQSFVPHSGRWRLPVHLEWSTRSERDMGNFADRSRVYEIVLAEGKPSDIRIWIDRDELIEFGGTLMLPRHIKKPVHEMIERLLRGEVGAA